MLVSEYQYLVIDFSLHILGNKREQIMECLKNFFVDVDDDVDCRERVARRERVSFVTWVRYLCFNYIDGV